MFISLTDTHSIHMSFAIRYQGEGVTLVKQRLLRRILGRNGYITLMWL